MLCPVAQVHWDRAQLLLHRSSRAVAPAPSTSTPTVVLNAGDPVAREEGQDTATVYLDVIGNTSQAIWSVRILALGIGSYPVTASDIVGLPASGQSQWSPIIQISPGQSRYPLVVRPIDDDAVEQSEQLKFEILPASAYSTAGSPQTVRIVDNEWRWVMPSMPGASGFSWSATDFTSVPRPGGFPVSDLSRSMVIQASPDSVEATLMANYHWSRRALGPSQTSYIDGRLYFDFELNPRSGDIYMNGATSYYEGVQRNNDLSGGLGFLLDKEEDGDEHNVLITLSFKAGAGGTYEMQSGGGVGFELQFTQVYSWAKELPAVTKFITLRAVKGSE